MRADNLLCLRKRRFVCTTASRHTYAVYPNLTRDWKPTGINQLWVTDITYIRLRESFLYLAVILAAYSRRVIGWALEDTLQAELAVKALGRFGQPPCAYLTRASLRFAASNTAPETMSIYCAPTASGST